MGLKRIPLEKVYPNPDQPRKFFDPKLLSEFASNIAENGLKQPITVRPDGEGKYMIVMGERRWRAHCILAERGKLPGGTILAHVRQMDDQQLMIDAILENMMRADISPLEEAHAFKRAIDAGLTEEQLAKKLGLSQPWRISYRLRLLNLAPEYQKLLECGSITLNAAQEIAKLEPADQTRIIKRIASGELKGDNQVATAVSVILDRLSQDDIFGSSPVASDADVATLNRMERKIEQVEQLLAQGWKDGECIAASKVSPDRTALMADKIAHIIQSLRTMEKALRETAIQVEMVMETRAA